MSTTPNSCPVETRLNTAGFSLPTLPTPAGTYSPTTMFGNLLFVSGQLPLNKDGKLICGRLGDDMQLQEGQYAAQFAALNVIAQIKSALGTLQKVKRIIKIGGFVQTTPDFQQHPSVLNAASNLMHTAFGKIIGDHSRFAVGVSSLPLGVAVEIEAIVAF